MSSINAPRINPAMARFESARDGKVHLPTAEQCAIARRRLHEKNRRIKIRQQHSNGG